MFRHKYVRKEVSKPHLEGKLGTNNQQNTIKKHEQSILLLKSKNNLFSMCSL